MRRRGASVNTAAAAAVLADDNDAVVMAMTDVACANVAEMLMSRESMDAAQIDTPSCIPRRAFDYLP